MLKLVWGGYMLDIIIKYLGLAGFFFGLINLCIKLYEMYSLKPKIYVYPIANFSETIRRIHNGEFSGKLDYNLWLHFDFISINNGSNPVQITSLYLCLKNKIKNEYYHLKLSHSTDFQPYVVSYEDSDKYTIKDEIINLQPHSSIRKHYIINFANIEYLDYFKANKYFKHNQYLEIHTSDNKIIYKLIL
jgi:hypothetical protein